MFPWLLPLLGLAATAGGAYLGAKANTPAAPKAPKAPKKGMVTGGGTPDNPLVLEDVGDIGQMGFYKTMTPEQQGLQNTAIQQALARLQEMGGQGQSQDIYKGFEPIAEQARRNFTTKTVPGLAERFTAMGGESRSGSMLPALASAGGDLETNLAALKSQYGLGQQKFGLQQQAVNQDQLRMLLGLAQQPSFESIFAPKQPSAWQAAAPGLAQGLGSGLASLGGMYALQKLLG